HLLDGLIERQFVAFRRPREAGKLAHELERSGLDLGVSRGRFKVIEGLDASTHEHLRSRAPWVASDAFDGEERTPRSLPGPGAEVHPAAASPLGTRALSCGLLAAPATGKTRSPHRSGPWLPRPSPRHGCRALALLRSGSCAPRPGTGFRHTPTWPRSPPSACAWRPSVRRAPPLGVFQVWWRRGAHLATWRRFAWRRSPWPASAWPPWASSTPWSPACCRIWRRRSAGVWPASRMRRRSQTTRQTRGLFCI